jgi:hypothetical protein
MALTGPKGGIAIDIFTVEGRLVASVEKPADVPAVTWDLTDAGGARVAPGIYLAKARGDAYPYSSKIVVLK